MKRIVKYKLFTKIKKAKKKFVICDFKILCIEKWLIKEKVIFC